MISWQRDSTHHEMDAIAVIQSLNRSLPTIFTPSVWLFVVALTISPHLHASEAAQPTQDAPSILSMSRAYYLDDLIQPHRLHSRKKQLSLPGLSRGPEKNCARSNGQRLRPPLLVYLERPRKRLSSRRPSSSPRFRGQAAHPIHCWNDRPKSVEQPKRPEPGTCRFRRSIIRTPITFISLSTSRTA